MSNYPLLTTLTAAGLLGAAAAVGTSVLADEDNRSESYRTATLPMGAVIAKLKQQGYGEIVEIERERGGYEAEVYDADGRRVELYIDGRSGDILGSEEEEYHDREYRDNYRRDGYRRDESSG